MKNIRRAWAVCLGCTLALLVCGGLCINAFSVAQPYILAQNGFTNTQTSMITTACSVTFLLCMYVANAYYEKLGYRVGLTLAVLLGAGSFVLFAEAKTLLSYYLAGMLAGVSYGLGAMLPASILMLRWFSSHRGTAIGICAAGTGVSAVVFSPILSALIERFSLRVCFYFEALVARPATGSGRKKQLALWRVPDRGADFLHAGGDQEHRAHAAGRDPLWRRHSFEHGGLERMGGGFLRRGAAPRRIQRFQMLYAAGGLAFSFMPGAIADYTGSYAPAYIVFTLFSVFTLMTVQSTYRLGSRSAA